MKRLIGSIVVLSVFCAAPALAERNVIDRNNLSLKAGPTEPGEGLTLVWLESFVYPKTVKADRVVSLGVRTAAKVNSVRAKFDFADAPVLLSSQDGLTWSSAYQLPERVRDGVHAVRFRISDGKRSINRTVDFYVEKMAAEQVAGPAETASWPLTVTAKYAVLSDWGSRKISTGQKLHGVAKMTWYKVVFEDGKEGWVPASYVKEPADELCRLGDQAFESKKFDLSAQHFRNAIAADPNCGRAYIGLAKDFLFQDKLDEAAEAISSALRIDDRDIDARVVAERLAQDYFDRGQEKAKNGNWQEAVGAYRRAVDLKPTFASAWLALSDGYRRIGLYPEAEVSMKEAIRNDFRNLNRLAQRPAAAKPAVQLASKPAPKKVRPVAPMVADESLQIVKAEKTNKGTKVDSAIKSVIALTKSLGTPIAEKGWAIKRKGEKVIVSYLCQQGGGALESFDWLVDVDTRRVIPGNDNARLLMSRW